MTAENRRMDERNLETDRFIRDCRVAEQAITSLEEELCLFDFGYNHHALAKSASNVAHQLEIMSRNLNKKRSREANAVSTFRGGKGPTADEMVAEEFGFKKTAKGWVDPMDRGRRLN